MLKFRGMKKILYLSFGLFMLLSFSNPVFGQNVVEQRRAELEAELKVLESAIAQQEAILQNKQKESVSLERDVAILNAKIQSSKLSIKSLNLNIEKLNSEITNKIVTIGDLSNKLMKEKQSLASIIRRTNEIESYSLVEVVLDSKNLSEFFEDLDSFTSIKVALTSSFRQIEQSKFSVEEQKTGLEGRRSEEVDLRKIQELTKRRIEEQEAEKKRILSISKGIEAEYQKALKATEQTAAKIRAELFTLRGSAAIPFERAYELAKNAEKETGVRPAFLLGIIAEESNLGENVGTGNWRVDMKHPRDTVPFLEITSELGLDPDQMPVSKKPWYGYGGAMGPAQFIPSTWVLFKDKVAKLTGHNPPNPWDPGDAFMASAVLLKDNGASKGGYANERLAALRYLAGWVNATKSAYSFYGDDVMALAEKYQGLIDILERS